MTRGQPLGRILTRRLLVVAASGLLVSSILVGLLQLRDLAGLQQAVLETQAERLARASQRLPDGTVQVGGDAEALFRTYPDAYGFAWMTDSGRLLYAVNPELLPGTVRTLPAKLDVWALRQQENGTERLIYGQRLPLAGESARIVVVKAGDPADLVLAVLAEELIAHILLPVVPAVVLLLAANLILVRRSLAPVALAARWARSVVPGQPVPALPTVRLPAEAADMVEAAERALTRLDASLTAEKRRAAEAAHALRTPVAVMQTRLDTIGPSPVRDQLRNDLTLLSRTVAQVLRAARADGLILTADAAVDLNALAEQVVSTHAPMATRRGVEIELRRAGTDAWIRGDTESVEVLLGNLVENALTHAHARQVLVSVTPTPSSRQVELRVEDDGTGIPVADREHLFEAFWRGAHSGDVGAGLGLAIVARIARSHETAVHYRARPEAGSVFVVAFKQAASPS